MTTQKFTARKKIPNLFIVGEQKSGTSALHNYLKKYSKIFMSEEKEPAFFASDLISDSIDFHGKNLYYRYDTLKTYLKLFNSAHNEIIIGESSSTYLYSKFAAKNIYNFNPHAKIIIIIREPVSFLFSLHSQYLKETTENETTFIKAVELENLRSSGAKIPRRVRSPSLLYYQKRANYLTSIQRFTKVFPKEQVKVLIYDNLVHQTEITLEDLLSFLSISYDADIQLDASNLSKTVRHPFFHQVVHTPSVKNFFAKFLSPKQQNFIKEHLNLILLSPNKGKLDTQTQKHLMQQFELNVYHLNEYLNTEGYIKHDLVKLWGYDKLSDDQSKATK